MQIQYETTCPQVKQELTNEDRMNTELFSVRAEYSETCLQLQNEKKVSDSLRSEQSALIDRNKILCGKISSLEREKNELLNRLNCSNTKISFLENENKDLCKKVTGAERNNTELLDKSNAQIKQINVLQARTKQLQFGVQQNTDYARQPKKKKSIEGREYRRRCFRSSETTGAQNSEEDTTFLSSLERICS